MSGDRDLWVAVILHAADDLAYEPLNSRNYSEAVVFWTSLHPDAAAVRGFIATAIDRDPAQMLAVGMRLVAQRLAREVPAPSVRKPAPLPLPIEPPAPPRVAAMAVATRRPARKWEKPNPFMSSKQRGW